MEHPFTPEDVKAIEKEIPVTNEQFALLQTAFLITYAIMYAAGGKLMDVLGTRLGFTAIMIFWSLACAGHGFASTLINSVDVPFACVAVSNCGGVSNTSS